MMQTAEAIGSTEKAERACGEARQRARTKVVGVDEVAARRRPGRLDRGEADRGPAGAMER
ncbi:MAG TPA: hypothetical protein VFG59_19870 [Anaeromyxobacter sp.]|nr:hypothetical protein [Anaeromyxobacter sp.]